MPRKKKAEVVAEEVFEYSGYSAELVPSSSLFDKDRMLEFYSLPCGYCKSGKEERTAIYVSKEESKIYAVVPCAEDKSAKNAKKLLDKFVDGGLVRGNNPDKFVCIVVGNESKTWVEPKSRRTKG